MFTVEYIEYQQWFVQVSDFVTHNKLATLVSFMVVIGKQYVSY